MRKLKIHTLNKGWCDKDEVLLHAAFQILVDFVEREKPGKVIDWNSDKNHKKAWREIRALYKWWKKKRPARKDPLYNKKLKVPPLKFKKISGTDLSEMVRPDKKRYSKYYKALKDSTTLEKQWHEEDQLHLHRLIDIRPYLWT
ncbi:MAG: hypothetical protein ACI8V2_003649 [Candidatus Latescibacterota bacterium]|jgi:hypothetical protein